jgi:serine/threonine protein phosphatase PrpC
MIRCATGTRTGRLHDENEDRAGTDLERGTFVVADGIGGLADAAATADAVVHRFPRLVYEQVEALRGPDVEAVVTAIVAELNALVRQAARSGPGTTGAATALLLVRDGLALAVHLGDSRIYLARAGQLHRLTEDHVHDGRLTRFVGMPGEVVPGVSVHEIHPGDRLLLCTDGLTGGVDDEALGALLTGGEVDVVCRRLVDAATEGGAVDDITVITVDYEPRGRGSGAAQSR